MGTKWLTGIISITCMQRVNHYPKKNILKIYLQCVDATNSQSFEDMFQQCPLPSWIQITHFSGVEYLNLTSRFPGDTISEYLETNCLVLMKVIIIYMNDSIDVITSTHIQIGKTCKLTCICFDFSYGWDSWSEKLKELPLICEHWSDVNLSFICVRIFSYLLPFSCLLFTL